jgi:hypothetical protein
MCSVLSKLRWVKAARIGADGRYPSSTYHAPEALYASPPSGGGSGTNMPSFCSVALSFLSSDHRRGPASHGRVYPPNFAAPFSGGTSKISSATQGQLVHSAQLLLAAVQNADNSQIVSPGIFSKIGAAASVIDSVRVGNIIDSQRRRKYAAPEKYVAGTFPA